MKNLSILGSTGSIGRNVLDIVSRFPEKYSVKALAAATNVELLAEQIKKFRPEIAVVIDEKRAEALRAKINGSDTRVLKGAEGYNEAASHSDVHMVVSAVVGAAGLIPAVAAINAGKDIALANKETLVTAGDYVMSLAREKNVRIIPVDSEHSAVFQCIEGQKKEYLSKIILTASGGPFRKTLISEFNRIKPEDALAHPTWNMGKKISVDSATLMNKGLEVIEAKHLFDVPVDSIDVLVHPQSVVHSMVSLCDGTLLAQLGVPDMRGAIAYALSWPERLDGVLSVPDLAALGGLTFEAPDRKKFPGLDLAYEACRIGHTLTAVLNAANEVAVMAFLEGRILFPDIPGVIESTMEQHELEKNPDLSDIIRVDSWARQCSEQVVLKRSCKNHVYFSNGNGP